VVGEFQGAKGSHAFDAVDVPTSPGSFDAASDPVFAGSFHLSAANHAAFG
jgi:hypothetical protein